MSEPTCEVAVHLAKTFFQPCDFLLEIYFLGLENAHLLSLHRDLGVLVLKQLREEVDALLFVDLAWFLLVVDSVG